MSGYNEVAPRLSELLEPLYTDLPADGKPSWASCNCVEWSEKALPIVRSVLGAQIEIVTYDHSSRSGGVNNLPGGYHLYLADMTQSDPLIVDGTYLQFGFPANPDAPHVLVSPASRTADFLVKAAIDTGTWSYWRADLYREIAITADR